MKNISRRALELAHKDPLFARIITSPDPLETKKYYEKVLWIRKTGKFATDAWVLAAIDAKNGIFKNPATYSDDEVAIAEIMVVQEHFRRFNEYTEILSFTGDDPFSGYLNGITVEEFRILLKDLRGMDAAREIQRLYKDGIIDNDLGGSRLHGFMEQLGLPYIPTVNHLNAARRGEISKGRYNMTKSRARDEKYL